MTAIRDLSAGAPASAGVYFFLDADGRLLYVGKAGNLRKRLQQHARAAPTSQRYAGLYGRVRDVRWELSCDEAAAADREADLILALRPSHNASLTDGRWQYCIVSPAPRGLTHFVLSTSAGAPTHTYGCFPHLGGGLVSRVGNVCADGYAALLRALWAASPAAAAGGSYPAAITRPGPPNVFDVDIAPALRPALHRFLTGNGTRLLDDLAAGHGRCQPYMRPALARDCDAARAFYAAGPLAIRGLRLRHGEAPGPLPRSRIEELLAAEVADLLSTP